MSNHHSNFILEGKEMNEEIIIGGMQDNQSIKTDGICTTLTSSMGTGGGYIPMAVECNEMIQIKQATKDGYIEMEQGGVFDASFPDSETRRGRVQEKGTVSPTITAQNQELYRIENQYRIRKLTPLECFRLMGVDDTDAKKMLEVNSNSQCYKQAGNSIVVDVMAKMFERLF